MDYLDRLNTIIKALELTDNLIFKLERTGSCSSSLIDARRERRHLIEVLTEREIKE